MSYATNRIRCNGKFDRESSEKSLSAAEVMVLSICDAIFDFRETPQTAVIYCIFKVD
jgi:hypothetical protein